MKEVFAAVLTAFLLIFIAGCGEVAPKEFTNIGEYDECTLELLDGTIVTTEEGQFLKVNAVYTNNKENPQYGSSAFAVRAFQNDKELDDWSFGQDNSGDLTREVRNGTSVNVSFLFKLDDNSEVEVLIGTPTADMETVGRAAYLTTEE